jgi:hypothetical protein
VVSKVRSRQSITKNAVLNSYMERFNLKKFNFVKVKEELQVKISNWFVALENLDDDADINSIWCSIRQYMKASAAESTLL